jgi:hypothetical protein
MYFFLDCRLRTPSLQSERTLGRRWGPRRAPGNPGNIPTRTSSYPSTNKRRYWISFFMLQIIPISVLQIRDILVQIRIHTSDFLDPTPDPAIFVSDLQEGNKNNNFSAKFFAYYFLKVHLHHFSKIKSINKSQKSRNQGFSYYFCLMMERSGSGSIPMTNRSGSGRPKNIRIRISIPDSYVFLFQLSISSL